MQISRVGSGIIAFLILMGLLVPSSWLIGFLRPTEVAESLMPQLLLGATLFKIGLVLIGLWLLLLQKYAKWRPTPKDHSSLPNRRHALMAAIVLPILLVALPLRLYRLDAGLWIDEIFTYVNYLGMPFGEIITSYDSNNQHFFYTLLARASFQIFGESSWSLRLPAALFGTASIWALILLGNEVRNTKESLFAAALMTFSYHHIWFSQNARGYIVILFFTIISSLLLLRGLREGRAYLWFLYACAVALGVYTHMTMLFVVSGHFIIYLKTLIDRRRESWPERWAGLLAGFVPAGLLTFQLYALVLPQMFGPTMDATDKTIPVWTNPLWTLGELLKGLEISFSGTAFAIAALSVFGIGFWKFAREKPVFLPLMVLPILVCTVVAVSLRYSLWPRFFFFIFGFAVLVVISGTMQLGQWAAMIFRLDTRAKNLVGNSLCAVLIVVSAASIPPAYRPKQDFAGALQFVEKVRSADDAVVTIGGTIFPYTRLYKTGWESTRSLERLNMIRSNVRRTWLLYTMPEHVNAKYPEIMNVVNREFEVVKEFRGTVGGGNIFVCRFTKSDAPSDAVYSRQPREVRSMEKRRS